MHKIVPIIIIGVRFVSKWIDADRENKDTRHRLQGYSFKHKNPIASTSILIRTLGRAVQFLSLPLLIRFMTNLSMYLRHLSCFSVVSILEKLFQRELYDT